VDLGGYAEDVLLVLELSTSRQRRK
jgi:hypothetical protein